MSVAPERGVLGIRRHFTTPGIDPYDEIDWDVRTSRLVDHRDGSVAFQQDGVEVPSDWSVNATNILAQKYFRGPLDGPGRESSLRQVADRVAGTIADWGRRDGYFSDDHEAEAFAAELRYLIVTQRAAFNSPVWFNIGVPGVPQQASACFILSVEDQMSSILNWYVEEGTIFKGGSGAGVNLSAIRSSKEALKGGGEASGPVSFMRGADASAGTIKSGGKTRRAAKMVILDIDHPDVQEFIWCKAREERKIRVLADAGFEVGFDGADSHSIMYQNANNSVRVTDEFMEAVAADADWDLTAVTDGSVIETVPARSLFRQMSEAAWECADPGIQFDTAINRWHTASNTGRISASNPCFTGDSLVHTDRGLVRFDELVDRINRGEEFRVWTHDATGAGEPTEGVVLTSPDAVMITGVNPVLRLQFNTGHEVRCTPNHRLFTANRGWVEAHELSEEDDVRLLDLPSFAEEADSAIPVSSDPEHYRASGDHAGDLRLPDEWSALFGHYLGWLIGDGSTSGTTTATVYGSAEDRDEIMVRHHALLEWINDDRPLKASEQANGTVQLRLSRRRFKRYLEALGVLSVTGAHKVVPWSILQAPPEIAAAFLRGLFDADGCVYRSEDHGSYVGLSSISRGLLVGVQRLLQTFGITSRIHATGRGGVGGLEYTRSDGTVVSYRSKATWDLRITGRSVEPFGAHVGFDLGRKQGLLNGLLADRKRVGYRTATTARLVARIDDGDELTYNLTEPRNHSYVVNGLLVSNCSEYVHLDDSACNLASINLLKFLGDTDDDSDAIGGFDIDGFRHAIEVVFTAQEILVGNADYPTETIGETTRAFRQLGLGYANLGALLMALGLPYDSDDGRAVAAAITSVMTGHAYRTSARLADRMGPFDGFEHNRQPMLGVLEMHRDAARPGGRRPHGLVRGLCAGPAGRRSQQPGHRAGAHRHHRPPHGLRHHRDRTRPEPREAQAPRRRWHDVDRQPDRSQGAATPRLRRGLSRRRRGLGGRTPDDGRLPGDQAGAPGGVRHVDGRQPDPPHGPRPHDGSGPAVPVGCHLQDLQHAGDRQRGRRRGALPGVVAPGPQGRGHLPRQLQGGPAAIGRQWGRSQASRGRGGLRRNPGRTGPPQASPESTLAHPGVPGGGLQGVRHDRGVRGRSSG